MLIYFEIAGFKLKALLQIVTIFTVVLDIVISTITSFVEEQ